MGANYESLLISILNVNLFNIKNIVSNVFSTLTQQQSRVTAQDTIVNEFNTNPSGKARVGTVFSNGIVVQGIWINKL